MVGHETVFDSTMLRAVGILVGTALVVLGSRYLVRDVERLEESAQVTEFTSDVLLRPVALGGAELAVILSAFWLGEYQLGVGTIVGSAIFNILLLPAVVGITAPGVVESETRTVYYEILWYLIAILTVTFTFVLGPIYFSIPESSLGGQVPQAAGAVLLLLFAVHFVVHKDRLPTDIVESPPGGDNGESPPDEPDADPSPDEPDTESSPDTPDMDAPPVAGGGSGNSWLTFAGSLGAVIVGSVLFVLVVDAITPAAKVTEFLVGLTFVAAATSIPEVFMSTRTLPEETSEVTKLTEALSSNVFDLLFALPIGILVFGPFFISIGLVVPVLIMLTAATLLLFTFLRTDLVLTQTESHLLLYSYLAFLAWVLVESIGKVSVLQGV